MRKLILASAIVLLSTSAFAGGSRSLSSSSAPLTSPQPQVIAPQPQLVSSQPQVVAPPPPPIVEPPRPARRAEVTVLPAPAEQPAVTTPETTSQTVEDKLKAVGELKQDGSPTRTTQTQAPVQTAPVQTQARLASAPAHATAPSAAKRVVHAQKPARQRVAQRRESTAHKVRRIAARFGIYW